MIQFKIQMAKNNGKGCVTLTFKENYLHFPTKAKKKLEFLFYVYWKKPYIQPRCYKHYRPWMHNFNLQSKKFHRTV